MIPPPRGATVSPDVKIHKAPEDLNISPVSASFNPRPRARIQITPSEYRPKTGAAVAVVKRPALGLM